MGKKAKGKNSRNVRPEPTEEDAPPKTLCRFTIIASVTSMSGAEMRIKMFSHSRVRELKEKIAAASEMSSAASVVLCQKLLLDGTELQDGSFLGSCLLGSDEISEDAEESMDVTLVTSLEKLLGSLTYNDALAIDHIEVLQTLGNDPRVLEALAGLVPGGGRSVMRFSHWKEVKARAATVAIAKRASEDPAAADELLRCLLCRDHCVRELAIEAIIPLGQEDAPRWSHRLAAFIENQVVTQMAVESEEGGERFSFEIVAAAEALVQFTTESKETVLSSMKQILKLSPDCPDGARATLSIFGPLLSGDSEAGPLLLRQLFHLHKYDQDRDEHIEDAHWKDDWMHYAAKVKAKIRSAAAGIFKTAASHTQEELLKFLKPGAANQLALYISDIVGKGHPGVINAIVGLVDTETLLETRASAVEALGYTAETGDEKVVTALLRCLTEPEVLRQAAVSALGKVAARGDAKVVAALLDCLNQPFPWVWRCVPAAAIALDDGTVTEHLSRCLEVNEDTHDLHRVRNSDAEFVEATLDAFRLLPGHQSRDCFRAQEAVCCCLKHRDERIRATAVNTLVSLADPASPSQAVIESLVEAMERRGWYVDVDLQNLGMAALRKFAQAGSSLAQAALQKWAQASGIGRLQELAKAALSTDASEGMAPDRKASVEAVSEPCPWKKGKIGKTMQSLQQRFKPNRKWRTRAVQKYEDLPQEEE